MSSRKRSGGNTAGRCTNALQSGLEDPSCASNVLSSPERPEVTGQSELLWLSGIVANSSASASSYVTKDDLASVLAGMKS